jgi:MerR family mercuric resistance operon transcriptional regulator
MSAKAKDPEQTLTIGEVARMAGVNIQTLRYYERRKLVPEPPRRTSGYRAYPLDTVPLIRFIKRAQDLGFNLTEIGELLRLRELRKSQGDEFIAIATEAIRSIDERRARLTSLRTVLEDLVKSCQDQSPMKTWQIVEALNE